MDEKFVERLKSVIGEQSIRSFAIKCGFSNTVLGKYLTGSEPSRPALIAIARTAGVSLEWLATGNINSETQLRLERAKLADEVASKLNRLANELRQ